MKKRYTLRELILDAALSNDFIVKDVFFTGYSANFDTEGKHYSEVCAFLDRLLRSCETHYGDVEFATILSSRDPHNPKMRPRRVMPPLYTSEEAVSDLINDISINPLQITHHSQRPFRWNKISSLISQNIL